MSVSYRNKSERKKALPKWWGGLESFIIISVPIVIGHVYNPDDPFFINSAFPWLIISTVLVALRYGFLYGLVSVLSVVLLYALEYELLRSTAIQEKEYVFFIGVAIVTMLSGEFRDYWQKNIDILQHSNYYRQIRLDEFTRSFHLLKRSHEQLQMRLGECGQNIREVLQSLIKLLSQEKEISLNERVAESVLGIMVEHGYLHQAALLPWNEDEAQLIAQPLACVGEAFSIDVSDDLVQACLKSRKLVSIRQDAVESEEETFNTQYQVVIPLIDCEEHLYGIVLVKKISFFAFEARNLRLLSVLAGSAADYINYARYVRIYHDEDDQCLLFRVNLKRSIYNRKVYGVPGMLVLMKVERNEMGGDFVALVEQMRRGLDVLCRKDGSETYKLLLLLPVTDEIGLQGYFSRLRSIVKERMGQTLDTLGVEIWHVETKSERAVSKVLEKAGMGDEVTRI